MTYLLGMLAGIVSHSDKVGYVAANPVYGVPAAINAFAQGVRAVRPDSRVVLRWACLLYTSTGSPTGALPPTAMP